MKSSILKMPEIVSAPLERAVAEAITASVPRFPQRATFAQVAAAWLRAYDAGQGRLAYRVLGAAQPAHRERLALLALYHLAHDGRLPDADEPAPAF